jgi:hypothetical protein
MRVGLDAATLQSFLARAETAVFVKDAAAAFADWSPEADRLRKVRTP